MSQHYHSRPNGHVLLRTLAGSALVKFITHGTASDTLTLRREGMGTLITALHEVEQQLAKKNGAHLSLWMNHEVEDLYGPRPDLVELHLHYSGKKPAAELRAEIFDTLAELPQLSEAMQRFNVRNRVTHGVRGIWPKDMPPSESSALARLASERTKNQKRGLN